MRGRERSQLRTGALGRGRAKLFSTQGLRCSAAAKTRPCLTPSRIYTFAWIPFCCCCCCCPLVFLPQLVIATPLNLRQSLAFHPLFIWADQRHIIKEPNDRTPSVWLWRKKIKIKKITGKESAAHMLSGRLSARPPVRLSVLLPVRLAFVRAQSSDAIWSFLVLTMQRRFAATGAIWELLSSAWAQYMHGSCFWVDLTWVGNK